MFGFKLRSVQTIGFGLMIFLWCAARLTRVEPSKGSTSSEVHELREQLDMLIDVVQQQAEASRRLEKVYRRQEEASKRQAEEIQRLQEMIAQQAEAAQTMQEHTESPHLGATAEGVAVAAEPMSTRPAPPVGATREMPRWGQLGHIKDRVRGPEG